MALSILTNPTDETKGSIWDSASKRFIFVGELEKAESTKHQIEQQEQEADNLQWLKEVFELRKKELTGVGVSEQDAERIIRYRMPKLYKTVKGK